MILSDHSLNNKPKKLIFTSFKINYLCVQGPNSIAENRLTIESVRLISYGKKSDGIKLALVKIIIFQ